jgi:hypothetical protein
LFKEKVSKAVSEDLVLQAIFNLFIIKILWNSFIVILIILDIFLSMLVRIDCINHCWLTPNYLLIFNKQKYIFIEFYFYIYNHTYITSML